MARFWYENRGSIVKNVFKKRCVAKGKKLKNVPLEKSKKVKNVLKKRYYGRIGI